MNKSNYASVKNTSAKTEVKKSNKSEKKVVILTSEGLLTVPEQRKELWNITKGALYSVGGPNNKALKHEDLAEPWAIINSMYIDGKFDVNVLRKCTGSLNGYLFIAIKNYLLDHCIWRRNIHKHDFIDGQNFFSEYTDKTREDLLKDMIDASYEYNRDTDSIIKSNIEIVQNIAIKIGLTENALFKTILDGFLAEGKTKKEIMPKFKEEWVKSGKKKPKDDDEWNKKFDSTKHNCFKALAQEKETYKKYRTY